MLTAVSLTGDSRADLQLEENVRSMNCCGDLGMASAREIRDSLSVIQQFKISYLTTVNSISMKFMLPVWNPTKTMKAALLSGDY